MAINELAEVGARRVLYRVLHPDSIAWWFTMALMAEHQRNVQLRDVALARAGEIATERKAGTYGTPTNA